MSRAGPGCDIDERTITNKLLSLSFQSIVYHWQSIGLFPLFFLGLLLICCCCCLQKPPRCANPSACSLINSSLHANVILQPGDSLRLTFDLDFSSAAGDGDDQQQKKNNNNKTTTTAAVAAATMLATSAAGID